MPESETVYVNRKCSFRKYRVDSIGYPESPVRCWLINLFKKYDINISESSNEKRNNIGGNHH